MRRLFLVVFLALAILPVGVVTSTVAAQAGVPGTPVEEQGIIPLGEQGTIGDFSFVVESFDPDASDMLNPAGPGIAPETQLVDIAVSITNNGANASPFPLLSYLAAGNRGVLETVAKYGVCQVKDSFWDFFSSTWLESGQTMTFHLCSPVPVQDIPSLRLALQDLGGMAGGTLTWFDLGNGADVDPQVAVDQAADAMASIDQEQPPFDDPAEREAVISTGTLAGRVLDYQPDATDDLVAAGMNAPVEGLLLAQVELQVINISDRVVNPVVELVGENGVGYESVHDLPVALEKDAWSIALMPGGQADMLLVFPVNADDDGNRLLYLGESPDTPEGLDATGAWLNPGDMPADMPLLPPLAPGDVIDPGASAPFGTRVALDTLTFSVIESEFHDDGSASVQVLIENPDETDFVVSPNVYIGGVGNNEPCSMRLHDGTTSTISDPLGMLAPGAAFTLNLDCPSLPASTIFISNYLINAPDGYLNAEFSLDPETAITSPETSPVPRDRDASAGEQPVPARIAPADMLIRLTDGNGFSLQEVEFDDYQFLNGEPVQDLDLDMVTAYEEAGILDLYITWDDFANEDGDVYSVSSRIVTFGDEEDAAAYTETLFDQVKANAGDDLKHLRPLDQDDLPSLDNGMVVGWQGKIRAGDGTVQPYLRYAGQVGNVVFSLQVGGPTAEVNSAVLDAMFTAQVDCLGADTSCDPIPFPSGPATGRSVSGAIPSRNQG